MTLGLGPQWVPESILCRLMNRQPIVDVEVANFMLAAVGLQQPRKTGRYRCSARDSACPAYCELIGGNVDPTTVLYRGTGELGVPLPESVHRLFADVRDGFAPKPVLLQKWSGSGWNGGGREFRHDVMVWLGANAAPYTVAHELAHLLSALRNDVPMIDPAVTDGYKRQVIGDVIGVFDHVLAHDILAEYGFDTAAESRRKCEEFLAVLGQPLPRSSWVDVHLALSYAHMLTVYATPDVTPRISERIHRCDPTLHALGQRIAAAVRAWRKSPGAMVDVVHRLCAAIPNGEYIAASIYSRGAFAVRFWDGAT